MRHHTLKYIVLVLTFGVLLSGCASRSAQGDALPESREAKQLMQGLWADSETESLVFKIQGDSVYYPDTTSMTAYFRINEDTLYIGSAARYHIEKQTAHQLWFSSQGGDVVKLVKLYRDEAQEADKVFEQNPAQVQTLTEVVKNDTVVFYGNHRYHLYVAINPTRYKVVRHTLNDDGIDVENVYYDNIIHLSIFEGSQQLFSRDFRKQVFQHRLSPDRLNQLILNNMEYVRTDASGFHLDVSLCVPGDASCHQIETVVSFDGGLTILK